jgi:hypothetical protein
MGGDKMARKIDFIIENHGTIFLFRPRTHKLLRELEARVQAGAQWIGNALVVEHRFALNLARGLQSEGYTVG